MVELPTPPQTQDFARYTSFVPSSGIATPSPSTRTDIPLLPTNNPVPPVPVNHGKHFK
jgi:hypothetical protein